MRRSSSPNTRSRHHPLSSTISSSLALLSPTTTALMPPPERAAHTTLVQGRSDGHGVLCPMTLAIQPTPAGHDRTRMGPAPPSRRPSSHVLTCAARYSL